MKKNLFCIWLVFAILFSVNTQAQMTIGGKKEPEAFSVLELLNKGGLRLPQMTTAQRNTFAVQGKIAGEGLTIYNIDTKCVEYWNAARWVSLCEGTSQTKISPQPCVNVAADGTGCDQTFNVKDPDCPDGPFTIAITAGSEYASLVDVDEKNGSFKVSFGSNESVSIHTVLVRVTSTCTSLYKEFLFSQNGVDCTSMPYAVPVISPSIADLSLCSGGAVYLSVPANTANLDKIIWTRNGLPIQGSNGASYIVATQKGEYNISMGAVGCNTNTSNKRTITESGTVTPVNLAITATNSGVICGTKKVTLSASGNGSASVVWFHNGREEKTGDSVEIDGDSSVGEWFAATKNGSCYSKPSSSIQVIKSEGAGQVPLNSSDVLVNGVPLESFTKFCSGGTLNLSVKNQQSGITYKWYNGNDLITVNPFIVPVSQSTISLRMEATDNSGARCSAEQSVLKADITQGSTPKQPNITGNTILCDGSTDLTVVPAEDGTYTYTWYKNGAVIDGEETNMLKKVTEGVYNATVTNTTGCTSTMAVKTVSSTISSTPVLSWVSNPATAAFGAKVFLQVSSIPAATSFTWTSDNGAVITGSTESVSVQLPASGTDGLKVKITVMAKNDCGNSVVKEHEITVNSACPTPIVSAQSGTAQNTTAGSSVTLSVSVDARTVVQATYKWYKTTTATNSGGIEIANETSASYSYKPSAAGTSYFYCEVKNGCTGTPAGYSPPFTVDAADNPGTLTDGEGVLSGKTCFDIALSNYDTKCGTFDSRSANKSDFTKPEIYNQTYTFTPKAGAAVSNVRFVCIESLSGQIIESYSGGNSGNNITSPVELKVKYYSSLNATALGKTTPDALSVTIYAVYNSKGDGSGKDVKTQLTAQIKDCACCGAMISATEWREFMCFNVGVTKTNLDPFKPSLDILGTSYAPYPYVDNCPANYHTPTPDEWKDILKYNTIKEVAPFTTKGGGGAMIGDNLFLPSVNTGFYWILYQASTGNNMMGVFGYTFDLTVGYFNQNPVNRNVRCMANK